MKDKCCRCQKYHPPKGWRDCVDTCHWCHSDIHLGAPCPERRDVFKRYGAYGKTKFVQRQKQLAVKQPNSKWTSTEGASGYDEAMEVDPHNAIQPKSHHHPFEQQAINPCPVPRDSVDSLVAEVDWLRCRNAEWARREEWSQMMFYESWQREMALQHQLTESRQREMALQRELETRQAQHDTSIEDHSIDGDDEFLTDHQPSTFSHEGSRRPRRWTWSSAEPQALSTFLSTMSN